MDGTAVFDFVMNEVPELILDLYAKSGHAIGETDLFLMHQPNKFMLNKLAERLDVPYARMPDWVTGTFGNSNSVTIPAAMTGCPELLTQTRRVCFAGFGVGLTWAAMLATIGPLSFNEQCQCP
jgi:3-oxoacyl-[acyl-carrier-protein] synthase-3